MALPEYTEPNPVVYLQASMASVRAVDGTFISYPFISDGDTTTKIYTMVCTQQASAYSASQVALDTPMSSAANAGVLSLPFAADDEAYFVGDSGHAPIGGGMISFTRTFANIPQTVTTPSGSAFVTFPGIDVTYVQLGVTSITSATMLLGTRGITLTTSADHGLSADNNVFIQLSYTVGTDPFIYQVSGHFNVIEAPSTTTLRVDVGHYWSEQVTIAIDTGSLRSSSFVRTPASINTATQTRYDYFLPGVTSGISTSLDIVLPPAFQAISTSDGQYVDTLTQTTTYPTSLQYMEMKNDEHNLVIESTLSEWAGNILVMKTKTCKAQ